MILLLGGASESAPLAQRFAEAGRLVLVSTATDETLDVGRHENIRRRCGRLDRRGLAELIAREAIRAVVDATHPYATEIRANARAVAEQLGVPYFTFVRPAVLPEDADDILFASDHDQAAEIAFSLGQAVLLTSGANHLDEYVAQARSTGLPLTVRVLPRAESLASCQRAGIHPEAIIAEKGPFTIEQNRLHIRQASAGVVVTKDGGRASGAEDKREAVRLEGARLVVVRRPAVEAQDAFDDLDALVRSVLERLP